MTSLAFGLLLLLLPAPPAAPWIIKQPTCRANCFITQDQLLQCSSPAVKVPREAVPIDCSATQLRDGLRLVIGGYESARAIAPDGLAVFTTAFKDQAVLLRLNLKLKRLDPDSIFPVLPKLRSLALLQPPKESCIFANVTAPLLSSLEFECLGLDRRPFELVLPPTNPQLRLKKCALSLECRSCGPRTIAVATTSHHLKLSQRMPIHTCPAAPEKPCPKCAQFTTTPTPPTTPVPRTTTPVVASEAPSNPPGTSALVKASPGAVAVAVAKGRGQERARSGGVARQAALVAALERRLVRTQNLLIVILCLTLANSLVLIGLCGYFARRRRWSFCGQRKDVYAVAKTAAT